MRWIIIIPLAAVLMGCGGHVSDAQTYTLYRNSALDSQARIHVATFDAADGDGYNQANCQLASTLFQKQDGVTTTFWCEKGSFKR